MVHVWYVVGSINSKTKAMAKFKGNVIMKNVRGTIGQQVLVKSYLGTEYMCAKPYYNDNRPVGEAEQANRNRFANTTEYAKDAMLDPELKALYSSLRIKKNHTSYITAKIDACYPPEIRSLITQGYSGKAGSVILVHAADNIKVNNVSMMIFDPSMRLVEQGEAVDNGDKYSWIYTATVDVHNTNGFTIEARAYDIAKNEAVTAVLLNGN
jgi:hypothetical protein